MFNMKKIIISLLVIAAIGMTWYLIKTYKEEAIYKNPAFASGNGRLEATEINIAAKLAGKIEQLLVDEGDYVKAGQTLTKMQTNTLKAELEQANATIKVKLGERKVRNGTKIVSWTTKPTNNVKFIAAEDERRRDFAIKDDGLYVYGGFVLFVK